MRLTRVFLNVEGVPYRRPAGANPFTFRETRPLRYRAIWVARTTSSDMYRSKIVSSQEEAVRLARTWLARQNKGEARYVDTTDYPERYGYAHEAAPAKPPAQLEREIAEALASKDES